jgi:hypothetical protein
MLGWFRRKRASVRNDLRGVMVTLDIGGEPALFVLLGEDGSINRLGTGAVDNTERDMFIGRTDADLFRQLREQITPELLGWCGQSRADPDPRGQVCELTVGFQRAGGEEVFTSWRYGSQSQGPPPEVAQFVLAAVRATDPWFAQQQAMVRGAGA